MCGCLRLRIACRVLFAERGKAGFLYFVKFVVREMRNYKYEEYSTERMNPCESNYYVLRALSLVEYYPARSLLISPPRFPFFVLRIPASSQA